MSMVNEHSISNNYLADHKFAYDCQIKACRIIGISASGVYLPKKGAQLQTMSREASEQYLKDNNQ